MKRLPVFFHPDLRPNLLDFGIEIPLSADRVSLCLENLLQDSQLAMDQAQWLKKITASELPWEDISLAHHPSYVEELKNFPEKALLRTYELINEKGEFFRYQPHKAKRELKELISHQFLHATALIEAAKEGLKLGASYLLGGGLHHAMSFSGRGFCLINDIVICLRHLQKIHKIKTAWIVDVDAHKGDGTAELTQHDPSIHTLSIHMAQGWPLENQIEKLTSSPWYIPSTIDVPIEAHEQKSYNQKLKNALIEMESLCPRPDFVIIVQGADPYEKDTLPSTHLLKLGLDELRERDQLVFNFFYQRKIPQTYVMAGGYGPHSHEVYAQFLKYFLSFKPFS